MLVCGRVEDRIDMLSGERVGQHRGIAAIAKHRYHLQARPTLVEFLADPNQRVFAAFDQHQGADVQLRALPAQFRTDRAAGTGDHHGASAQPLPHGGPVGQDRIAPEQILDRHFLERGTSGLTFENVLKAWQGPHRQAGFVAQGHHPLHRLGIGRRHGDHQQIGGNLAGNLGDPAECAQHRHTLHLGAMQTAIVIDDADHRILATSPQIAQQTFGAVAGAEHQHPRACQLVLERKTVVLPGAIQDAWRAEQQHQCKWIDHQGGTRHTAELLHHDQADHDRQQTEHARPQNVPEVGDAGKAPEAAIQADMPEHQTLGGNHDQRLHGDPGNFRRQRIEAVSQSLQTDPANQDHGEVVADDQRSGYARGEALECSGQAWSLPARSR